MMKNLFLPLILVFFLLTSCEKKEVFIYEYEKNPQYTWGFARFWGAYYADYEIENNILSLSAFTNSLSLNDDDVLIGTGVYLYMEDIFVAPSDTLFPNGIYQISDSVDVFSIARGEEYTEDNVKYDVGARVYFIEENENYSIRKFIDKGSMTVTQSGDVTRFDFNFILNDSTELKGYYEQYQLHYEYNLSQYLSVAQQKVKSNQIKTSSSVKFKPKPQDERRQKNNAKQVIQTKFHRQGN